MSMFLLGAITGIAIVSAVAAVLFDNYRNRAPATRQVIPEFSPRRHPPRAITRIHSNDIFWEIR